MPAVRNLEVVYDHDMVMLRDVSLEVADGAGKRSLRRAVSIHHVEAAPLARRGVKHVMENRRVVARFSVEENRRPRAHVNPSGLAANLDRVFGPFPILPERRRRTAGYISGGKQQMLAIGRALMSNPRHFLSDGPSLGLAPRMVMDKQARELIRDREIRESYLGSHPRRATAPLRGTRRGRRLS